MREERIRFTQMTNSLTIKDKCTLPIEVEKEDVVVVNKLVLAYLLNQGFADTARAFANDVLVQRSKCQGISFDFHNVPGSAHIDARKRVKSFISEGDVENAMLELQTSFPQVFERRYIRLALMCLNFVEMVANSTLNKDTSMDIDEELGSDEDSINHILEYGGLIESEYGVDKDPRVIEMIGVPIF